MIPAAFRAAFPNFADTTKFPDAAIAYWVAAASLLLPYRRWGVLSPEAPSFTGVINGTVLTVSDFVPPGSIMAGMSLFGAGVIAGTKIISGDPSGKDGTYGIAPSQNVAAITMSAAYATPQLISDILLTLFVAHNLTLEAQIMGDGEDDVGTGGMATGPVSSVSMGGLTSVSYDVSVGIEPNAGHWNNTIYGQRFIRLARLRGAAPMQMGVGPVPPFTLGAWAGPFPFPAPGQSGFSN